MKKILANLAVLTGILGGATAIAYAQPAATISRIGFLSAISYESFPSRIDAFRQGLKDLGYVDGSNIVVEYRWARGNADRLPELATELESMKVKLIVSGGPSATRAAKQATTGTPIVMAFDSDPVGSGFVDSLRRPGDRITGLSFLAPEISGKQVDILRQIIPGLSRLALLEDSKEPGNARAVEETVQAAKALGMSVHRIDVRRLQNIEDAFQGARNQRVDAAIVLPSPLLQASTSRIVALASKHRLPAMGWAEHYVEAGGLMTYSANIDDLFRRAATYVDRILKGGKPSEMPIEQPAKFDFVINLKAANQIGLTIPLSVLARADRVIH